MNRRSFIKSMGVALATVAVAPMALLEAEEKKDTIKIRRHNYYMPHSAGAKYREQFFKTEDFPLTGKVLTDSDINREALRIFHEKLRFTTRMLNE